ncbi:MAG TPA: RHS repeat-associated core domain-containing protein [Burkholderiales bacterium]|nr:RHS repeat-associated core domain-containing protein [Burkholderiales bacterium]
MNKNTFWKLMACRLLAFATLVIVGTSAKAACFSTPSSMGAIAVSTSQINLNWTPAGPGVTFNILRSVNAVNYSSIGTVASSAGQYINTGLAAGTTYYYYFSYVFGPAPCSTPVISATTVPFPPTAPIGLNASPISTNQINLGWMDTSNNETGFRVERKLGASGTYSQIGTTAANVTSYSDSTLSEAKTYFYRIRAANSGGVSAYSNEASRATLPGGPTGLSATPVPNAQINLSWTDNSAGETGFNIERKTGTGAYAQIAAPAANTTSYSDPGLVAGSSYFYRVSATNGSGNSVYSNETSATAGLAPAAPGTLSAVPSGLAINLSWVDASNNETAFKIERKTGATGTYSQIATSAANATSYSDPGLVAGTTYFYRARATNTIGDSPYSNETSATTPNPPAPPSNLSASASGPAINLTWTDASNNETGFKLERRTGAHGTYSQIATPVANSTSYSDPGLAAGTPYFYRIRASNGPDDSVYSNEASTTTPPTPNTPTGLGSIAVSGTQINLTWTDTSSDETGFKLERKTGASGVYAQIATPVANAVSYSDSGLVPGTAYFYRVRSTSIAGDSDYSNVASSATPLPDVTANATITYNYDPFGNLIQTNAGGVITGVTYDLRGRKTNMSDPDMGAWIYAYNALGELIRQTDARGNVSTMQYDPLGRMSSRSEPDMNSIWTYDNCTMGVGKLCQVNADNGFASTYGYDPLGRLKTLTTNIDVSYTVTTTYDGFSRVDTVTYPDTFAIKNGYNAFGYLSSVTNNTNGSVLWVKQAQTFQPSGGTAVQEVLGNPSGAGALTNHRFYDALNRLTSTDAVGTAGTQVLFNYSYDPIGNLAQRVVDGFSGVTENFSYDSMNRLTLASGTNPAGTLVTRSLDYDVLGNIIYKSDVGVYGYGAPCGARTCPHAVANVSGTVNASYTYDANGNLTYGASRTLTYTSFNLPLNVGQGGNTFQYTYNADHERVRLLVNRATGVYTTVYLHPGGAGNLLYEKETLPDGTIENRNYVTAAGGLIGVYVIKTGAAPEMRYYHRDHLGSIVAISNEAGTVTERLSYEAFGKRRAQDGTADPDNRIFGMYTDRGFTAHEHLEELGLIHMNGRVYDPLLGRFMTADSFLQSPTNLQSYNRYSYVWNNPLAFTDPSGHYNLGKKLGLDRPLSAITGTIRGIADSANNDPGGFFVGLFGSMIVGGAIGVGLTEYDLAAETSTYGYATTTFTPGGGVVSGYTFTWAGSAIVNAGSAFAGGLGASGGDFRTALRAAGISFSAWVVWEAMAEETDRLARMSGNMSDCDGRPCTYGQRVSTPLFDANGKPIEGVPTATGFALVGRDVGEVLPGGITRQSQVFDSLPGMTRFMEAVSKVHDFTEELMGGYDALGRSVLSANGLVNDFRNLLSYSTMLPSAAFAAFAYDPGITSALIVSKENNR